MTGPKPKRARTFAEWRHPRYWWEHCIVGVLLGLLVGALLSLVVALLLPG